MSEGKHLADSLVAFFAYTDHRTFAPFTQAVAGLTAAQAAAQPAGGLHSVWAEVNHIRFWHEVNLCQLRSLPVDWEALGATDGWPPPADPAEEEAWQEAVSRTVALNEEVAELVEGLSDEALEEAVVAGYVTRWQIVQSLIAHNAYHTGAIIAIRRTLGLWAPSGQ
jgi:uncharacterized damage-inducible protein DinB